MRETDSSAAQVKDVPQPVPSYSKVRTLILSNAFVLGAGFVASLVTVCVMSILRVAAGIPTPVELFSYFILKHITAAKFVDLQSAFQPNPKTVPLGLAVLGMIAAGTVISLLYAPLVRLPLPVDNYRPRRREWLTAFAIGLVLTLIAAILFQEELRRNQFGVPILISILLSILGLVLDFGAYAVVLALAYRAILPKQAIVNNPVAGRRLLLSRVGVTALGVGATAGTAGAIAEFLKGYTHYDGMQTAAPQNVTSPITPNDQHYVVTQNTVDPTVNTDVWQLEVTGLVNKPGTYNYDALQKLPSTSRAITLECIANGVGSHLISTAVWQGVTLSTLLEQHGGPTSAAKYVAFYSVDDYTVSLPLAEVLDADALLAWRMNGEILPQRHGFPLRVLVPGRFGEENPKWLTRVELTDHFVGGLYSDQHWYNGPLHLTSRIDRPRGKVAVGHTVEVGGIAFGGSLGIQKVEVSTDSGSTWNAATLQPALSKDAWVLWAWQWTPTAPGNYTLVARATNGKGELQVEKKQGTVPNGATGYHMVPIQVV